MAQRNDNTVMIEDAKILFRNFSGAEGQYNAEGDRNFSVLLDPQVAEAMANDGWPVKYTKIREEGDIAEPFIQVSVKYQGRGGKAVRPPRITMITSRGRTNLGEGEVELLDSAEIISADMIIRPFEWSVGDKSGIKAYLQTLFVKIQEDALELKYADLNEAKGDYDE